MSTEIKNLIDATRVLANLRQNLIDDPYAWGKLFNAGYHLHNQIDAYFGKEVAA